MISGVKAQFFTLAAVILASALISSAFVISTITERSYEHTESMQAKYIFEHIKSEYEKLLDFVLANYTQAYHNGQQQNYTIFIEEWKRALIEEYSKRGIEIHIRMLNISIPLPMWNVSPATSTISSIINLTVSDGTATISDVLNLTITYNLTIYNVGGDVMITLIKIINNEMEGVDFANMTVFINDNPYNVVYKGGGLYDVQNEPRSISSIYVYVTTPVGVYIEALLTP